METTQSSPFGQSELPVVFAPRHILQWSSNSESRIDQDTMDKVYDCVRNSADPHDLFPMHLHFGDLSLDMDGYSVWMTVPGGRFLAGELIDESVARPRTVPASGSVDISKLGKEAQLAIMTLLRAADKR